MHEIRESSHWAPGMDVYKGGDDLLRQLIPGRKQYATIYGNGTVLEFLSWVKANSQLLHKFMCNGFSSYNFYLNNLLG